MIPDAVYDSARTDALFMERERVTYFKDSKSQTGGTGGDCLTYAMVLKTNVEDLAVFRKWVKDALTALSDTEVVSQTISCDSVRVSKHCKILEHRKATERRRSR